MNVCGRPDRSLREARTTAIPESSRSSDQVLRKVTVGLPPEADACSLLSGYGGVDLLAGVSDFTPPPDVYETKTQRLSSWSEDNFKGMGRQDAP